MTFGSGGHTRAILQKESDITLYALDRDPTAYAIAEQLSELYPKQIRALLGQFSQAEALLMKAGVQPGTLDGVLLDPGCSSMQLDAPERGFSLRKDGPLDMRMDGGRYPDMPTAADVVNALDQQALASILRTYGEEKHAKKIASAIVQARSLYPISRTQQLASIVADLLTYRMLRYPYFCRLYKEFLSCWWESGIFNSGVWPKRIHDTAQRYNECEAREQTDQTGTQEMHRPQDRDNEAVTKLHIPVMVDEVVRCLAPQKGQIFLDMTFGSGGHTRAILQKESDITLYALDRDPTAYAIAEQLSELYPKQIRALLGQFSQAEALLMKAGVQPGTLDGVLLDPGCSSMQLDAPERGFSLRKDGPLDMRMDGGRYPDMPTAADVVNALDQQALASILRTYGEEKHAKKIASAIVQARSLYPISRTQQLASIVAGAFPPSAVFARKDLLQRSTHIATKTFQAFRIFVNNELNELYTGLKTAQKFLRPGGRLVALSFHSLEDRIVKRFLLGISMTERFNLSARQKVIQALKLGSGRENMEGASISKAPLMWELIHKKVLTPDDQEVQENPRARSAKLRAAIKL